MTNLDLLWCIGSAAKERRDIELRRKMSFWWLIHYFTARISVSAVFLYCALACVSNLDFKLNFNFFKQWRTYWHNSLMHGCKKGEGGGKDEANEQKKMSLIYAGKNNTEKTVERKKMLRRVRSQGGADTTRAIHKRN